MGNNGSDFYVTADLSTSTSLRDIPIKYFWVDPKVKNEENDIYLKKLLEQKFNVDTFEQVDAFKLALTSIYYDKCIIRVLCAASLKEEDYLYLDNNPKINAVFLFCGAKKRADDLMAAHKKIRHAAFTISQVMCNFAEMETEEYQSILFYRSNELAKINQHYTNYGSLITDISRLEGKAEFVSFVKKLYPQNEFLKQFDSTYSLKLEGELKQLQALSWAFKNQEYYSIVARALRESRDPTKLAYLRLPIHDLYHAIRDSYQQSTLSKQMSVLMILGLNSVQAGRLMEGKQKFIMVTSFVKTVFKCSELKRNEYSFKVRISAKNKRKRCNGYYIHTDKAVIFNMGNIFSVDRVNVVEGVIESVELTLLQFNETYQAQAKWLECISMNKQYNDYQIAQMDGQNMALLRSGYIDKMILMYKEKIDKSKKAGKPVEEVYRLHFQIVDGYLECDRDQTAETYLSLLQLQANSFHKSCIEVYLAEIQYRKGKSLEDVIPHIESHIKEFKLSTTQGKYMLFYCKCAFFCAVEKLNKKKYQLALQDLSELRREMIEHYGQAYLFTRWGKRVEERYASCLSYLSRYLEAKSVYTILYDTAMFTEGPNPFAEKINKKIERQEKLYLEEIERIQIQTKRAKITSKVPLRELRKRPMSPIRLNIAKIDQYFQQYALK